MKVLSTALLMAVAKANTGNAVTKVVELLNGMIATIQADGAQADKNFDDFKLETTEMLEEKTDAIRRNEEAKEQLEADIAQAVGDVQANSDAIEELTGTINSAEAELAAARATRKKENDDFNAAEKELVDSIDMLDRAYRVLERSLNGGSTAQVTNLLQQVTASLIPVIDAVSITSSNASKLKALLQQQSESFAQTGEEQPEVAAYESKSGGILDVIADMKEKAEATLADLRMNETKSRQAFEMLAQSLTDQINQANKDLTRAKDNKAGAQQAQGDAEGELKETNAALTDDKKFVADTEQMVKDKTEAHNNEAAAMAEEIEVIRKAITILQERFNKMFLQMDDSTETEDDKRDFLADALQKSAANAHSMVLQQLAARVRAGNDPFAKVKGLIKEMKEKLEKKLSEEAGKQAWCLKERKETEASRDKAANTVEKITARVDKTEARLAKTKQEIADLGAELADMEAQTAAMTKQREEDNAEYVQITTELTADKEALTKAIGVLSEYYNAEGGAGGYEKSDTAKAVITLLETTESDTSKALSERQFAEEAAAADFKKFLQDFKVNKAKKAATQKGKQSEVVRLEETLTQQNGDLKQASDEFDAAAKYLEEVNKQCTHKPMTFEERQAKRQAEIAGLKEALDILSNETAGGDAFLQKKVSVHEQ